MGVVGEGMRVCVWEGDEGVCVCACVCGGGRGVIKYNECEK